MEELPLGPTLVVLDDVWDAAVAESVANGVPESVTVLVTSRGLSSGHVVVIGEAAHATARDILLAPLRDRRGSVEAPAAADDVVHALRRWPLLLSLAGRQVADTATDRQTLESQLAEIALEFAANPTILDDPAGDGSLTVLIERSLDRIDSPASSTHRECFTSLAVYRAGLRIPVPALAVLWGLSTTKARQSARALDRAGLLVLEPAAGSTADTVVVHDVVLAWLHRHEGTPDDPALRALHRRSLPGVGAPERLTTATADPLLYHVLHGQDPDQVEQLLDLRWQTALAEVTGSDARYLQWLGRVTRWYLGLRTLATQDRARHLRIAARAILLATRIEVALADVAPEALGVLAVLDSPVHAVDLAIRRRTGSTPPFRTVLGLLMSTGRLTPQVIELPFPLLASVGDDEQRAFLLVVLGIAAAQTGSPDTRPGPWRRGSVRRSR